MDLKEELKEYSKMSPEGIYLDHCQKYAKQYLDVDKIVIEEYKFTTKDVEDRVISNKLMEILRLQEADQNS